MFAPNLSENQKDLERQRLWYRYYASRTLELKDGLSSRLYIRHDLVLRPVTYDLVLRKAGLRQVACIVRERQLRLYGHVARLPAEDPAHRILS